MIKKNLILHVGLGRTSTTTLQKKIFPKLCNIYNYKYADHSVLEKKNQDLDIKKKIIKHIERMVLKKKSKALTIQGKVLISSENLSGWNPIFYEQFSEDNLIAFGKNAHVMLVIREPLIYLNSVYNHQVIRAVPNYRKPSNYFIDSRNLPNTKFSAYAGGNFAIDYFSYKNLINFYRKRFNKVTVVKYESLENMQFLNEFFPVDNLIINKLKKEYQTNILNYRTKISKFMFYISHVLYRLRYIINGIKFIYNIIFNKPNTKINRSKNNSNEPGKNIYKKIYNFLFFNGRLYVADLYKIYILNLINDIFNFKQYNLKLNKYIDIEIIKQLKEEYSRIPSIVTYIKKNKN